MLLTISESGSESSSGSSESEEGEAGSATAPAMPPPAAPAPVAAAAATVQTKLTSSVEPGISFNVVRMDSQLSEATPTIAEPEPQAAKPVVLMNKE
jgi:hypothetical protein